MASTRIVGFMLFISTLFIVDAFPIPPISNPSIPYHKPSSPSPSPPPPSPHSPPPEQYTVAYIQGYVYCQTCNSKWSKSLPGALVALSCMHDKIYQKSYADSKGYFQFQISSHIQIESCKVSAIASYDTICSIPVKTSNGKITFSKVYKNAKFYKTDPLAFGPATCPKPHY